jgi:ATP-dependent Clp protease, protease subunit
MPVVPTVFEKSASGMLGYDIYSKLLKDRIIFVGSDDISMDGSNLIISQLLFLESESTDLPISMYINSPGGSVHAGLAIYDTMQHIKAPIRTICMGMAMSFGAVLLAAGQKGNRFSLPNSRIMIHQPLIYGHGITGQATEIEIEAKEMAYAKKQLTEILAKHCNQSYEKLLKDAERNYYLSAEDAKEYGLIDKVIYPSK